MRTEINENGLGEKGIKVETQNNRKEEKDKKDVKKEKDTIV